VLRQPALATDARFATNGQRTTHRAELEVLIQRVFDELTYAQAVDRLTVAQTAYGAINSVHDLIQHPQLRTWPMPVDGRPAQIPATPYRTEWDDEAYPPAPRIDEHGPAIREELGVGTTAAA
jgi:crotonobetainyl-CoA:carnitine CoA-transferase CaiB-like acyl-CoA transferase